MLLSGSRVRQESSKKSLEVRESITKAQKSLDSGGYVSKRSDCERQPSSQGPPKTQSRPTHALKVRGPQDPIKIGDERDSNWPVGSDTRTAFQIYLPRRH